MRDRLAVGIAMLQAIGNGLELVGGLLRQLGARLRPSAAFRIVEDRAQDGEIFRLGEIVEVELVVCGDFVGPARFDAKAMRVAGDVQRRVFERRRHIA